MRLPFVAASLLCAALSAAPGARADGESWQHARRSVVAHTARPATATRACSAREPVCVHAPDEDLARVEPTLAAAERSLAVLRSLGLPDPQWDGDLGGDGRLDIYLDPTARGAAAWADVVYSFGELDRASAYAVVGPGGPRCALPSDVARVLAQAALLGLDPAMNEGTLAMQSSYLASFVGPCPALEAAALDEAQRTPERALDRHPRHTMSAPLLPLHLDAWHGAGVPGQVAGSLIALAAQHTAPEAERWDNEPDIYDAARRLLKPLKRSLDDLLVELAIARAFAGSRSDGAHLPDTERFGDLGRVRFDWAIELGSLPRRVAPLRPLEPTGATYLWLDLTGATDGDRLTLSAEWEEGVVFRWAIVKVDQKGQEIGRSVAPGVRGHTRAQLTVAKLDAAALLIVGTSAGSDNPAKPYDPDDGERRAASCEISLYRQ